MDYKHAGNPQTQLPSYWIRSRLKLTYPLSPPPPPHFLSRTPSKVILVIEFNTYKLWELLRGFRYSKQDTKLVGENWGENLRSKFQGSILRQRTAILVPYDWRNTDLCARPTRELIALPTWSTWVVRKNTFPQGEQCSVFYLCYYPQR